MSLTGLFLIVFLVVHCYVNAQIFYFDGGVRFLEAAHFMGTNMVIRTTEIGLFVFLLLHIIRGFALASGNSSKRSQKYAVSAGSATSPWYSRSMAILGTLILLFLCLHLYKFWAPNRLNQLQTGEELNLYTMMKEEFQMAWVVVVYGLGCISLGWHLVHGFYSALQTLGLGTSKYKGLLKGIGIGFAIIVPLIFFAMPLFFYMGWLQ